MEKAFGNLWVEFLGTFESKASTTNHRSNIKPLRNEKQKN